MDRTDFGGPDEPVNPVHIAEPVNHISSIPPPHHYLWFFLLEVDTRAVTCQISNVFHDFCLGFGPW
jgi:hypothetical protein